MANQQLAEELYKPIIRKFEKWKAYLIVKDNIWGADYANLQLISRFNKSFYYAQSIFLVNMQGSGSYNRPKASYLQDNDIEIYSAHSEGKPVIELLKTIFTNTRLEYQKICILKN